MTMWECAHAVCEPFMGHNCIFLVDVTAIERGRQSGKYALMHECLDLCKVCSYNIC